MKKRSNKLRFIIATFFLFAVLFLAQPAHAASPTEDPLTFIADLIEAFITFLAKLFGA